MIWFFWLVLVVALSVFGARMIHTGKTSVVRYCAIGCVTTFAMIIAGVGYAVGVSLALWLWMLCTALAASTVILAIVAFKRDRTEVLGASRGREAIASAAVMHGAGSPHEGGVDAGGGGEM
ncbi:MAG: hypothetical protein ACR2PG_22300 [Hyphomicrobiaceae bacterium]